MNRTGHASQLLWLALACIVLPSCAALWTLTKDVGVPTVMKFARSLIQTTASNYVPDYQSNVVAFLDALDRRTQSALGGHATPVAADTDSGVLAAATEHALEEGNASDPAPDAPTPAPLRLTVALLEQVDSGDDVHSVPLADGDTLTRGATDESSDRLRLYCRTFENCYLYIVWIDGSGWVQPVFPGPLSEHMNPLPVDTELMLPGNDEAFAVDETRGIETVFFVASRTQRQDLETLIARFADWERPDTPQTAAVDEPVVFPRGAIERPGPEARITTRSGSELIDTTTFLARYGDADLVVTRWFVHQ